MQDTWQIFAAIKFVFDILLVTDSYYRVLLIITIPGQRYVSAHTCCIIIYFSPCSQDCLYDEVKVLSMRVWTVNLMSVYQVIPCTGRIYTSFKDSYRLQFGMSVSSAYIVWPEIWIWPVNKWKRWLEDTGNILTNCSYTS